jgi:acyl-CoA synthetase (AMP-forming)/AMP-acid ligase II
VRIDKWLGQEPDPPARNRRVAISMSPANVWALTGALAALFRGGSVLMLSADRERLLGYLDLYRADTLLATPALLSQLAGDPASAQYLGGLRDIRVGGAQAPRNVIARLAELCGARIHLTYGAAEVGAVFAFTYDPSDPQPEGYLGRPVETGLQVGLYSDAQEPLPEDAVEGNLGIRVTDPSILRCYLKKGGELEEVTQLGDVFFPGDLVRRENDEYFYVGRTKNVLNAGGEKYALDVIGRHLTNVLGGSMVVPLVKQDEAGNEALVLITERSPIDLDAARAALATRFPSARVLAAEAVERFPLTPSGKVDPSALARAVGIRS